MFREGIFLWQLLLLPFAAHPLSRGIQTFGLKASLSKNTEIREVTRKNLPTPYGRVVVQELRI